MDEFFVFFKNICKKHKGMVKLLIYTQKCKSAKQEMILSWQKKIIQL